MSQYQLDGKMKFVYGLGAAPFGIKENGFSYFLLIFYSQVLGLQPFLTSLALTIAIAVDAITDPLIGYWSDNLRSKWGRRHPFMYLSIVPICLSYAVMWNPPSLVLDDQMSLFFYLLFCAVLIRVFLTFFEVPSTALISELTSDYDTRTELMGLRFMFGWLGGIGMAFLAYSTFLAANENGNGILQAGGYVKYGLAASALMFVGMVVSSLGTHRAIPHLHMPPEKTKVTPRMVAGEIFEVFKNKNFQALFLASIFFGTASGFTASLSIYFSTFFWELQPSQLAIFTIFQAIAAICAVPIARLLGRRFDKKRAALGSFVVMLLIGPSMWLSRLAGLLPENGSDALFPILLTHNFLQVLIIIVFYILFGSMMADVVEDSAVDTARRNEGVIFAARAFAGKMVAGMGILLAGLVLTLINMPRNAQPSEVAQETLVDLVLYAVPIEAFFYIAAFFMMMRYRITRRRHGENVEKVAQI
jgi:GPH family glycoside/pentoside/hexuronide:cation symporter